MNQKFQRNVQDFLWQIMEGLNIATPWSGILPEKLTVVQLAKKFPHFLLNLNQIQILVSCSYTTKFLKRSLPFSFYSFLDFPINATRPAHHIFTDFCQLH
jgi:hypothetical protein